jgi:hypothetical protein
MKNYFQKMLQEINYNIVPGLLSEIRDCLKYNDKVHESNLVIIQDKTYSVAIRLKEYNVPNVKNVFSTLVQFIQYTSTFYVRNDKEKSIEYSLISQSEGGLAFYCRITFS